MAGSSRHNAVSDRVISLGDGLAAIPEPLLLAHARGQVLFIAGASISQPAGLPDFRGLVLRVYEQLDLAEHDVLFSIPLSNPPTAHNQLKIVNQWDFDRSGLTAQQAAEVKRFIERDYDVVLGMLERRMERQSYGKNLLRRTVASILRGPSQPDLIHRALMRLADRGGAVAIATTNFDLLLEEAARQTHLSVQTYTLGGIPRSGHREDFSGVFHIHGALDPDPARTSDLILTESPNGIVSYLGNGSETT